MKMAPSFIGVCLFNNKGNDGIVRAGLPGGSAGAVGANERTLQRAK